MRSLTSAFCALVLGCGAAAVAQQSLEAGFQNPPQSAKARTWWHWINGNISKAGITADLEAMKRFGLGGAQIFNVDVGIPAGDTPFMSERWKDALAWAFHEARRLGLELDIHNGAGWSSSGGPWVTPAHSMQFLTWSETSVRGPKHFEAMLPEPVKKLNFYRDIVCYAVKKPANDQFRVARIQEKAAFERGDRIAPDASAIPAGAAIPLSDIREVKLGPGGRVDVDLPAGDWTLVRMGHTPTGAQNEPSPKPGLGAEVDKLSREAMDEFWSGMMATAVKANGPVSQAGLIGALIDSYEVGSQNWTPKFREEFRKRRGYNPLPYLLAVTGRVVQDGNTTERFLWDLRSTISDLFADNYYGYMAELCHMNGLKFSTEGYGNGSFDNLQVSGIPDVPMAEFWIGGLATETTKMVASSAHTYGKPVIGAEAFTADDQHAKWLYDLYAIKALGDKMFCLGINRYIFHRFAHQPWLNLEPGMTMGPWGTNFDRTITWWDQGREWMKYVARCQYLLQSGRFVADVLAFEGDDGPNDLPMKGGKEVPEGYDYDGCDSKVLAQARVENAEIVLPSGMRYRVLLLPNSTWMTLRTAHKLQQLVLDGATVVGPQPQGSPSLAEAGAGDAEVAAIGQRLWSSQTGKGRVLTGTTTFEALHRLRVQKDLGATQPLNWIHRRLPDADIYFVANSTYKPVDVDVTFRVSGKQPELWNPETGETQPSTAWQSYEGGTVVPLHLESAGSTFVVFRKPAPVTPHLMSVQWRGEPQNEPKPPKIEIVSARYEALDGTGGTDVTAKVRSLVEAGETSIAANNSNFGDPTYNHAKRLHITYSLDGKRFTRDISENDTLVLVPAGPDDGLPTFTLDHNRVLFWRPGTVSLWFSPITAQSITDRPDYIPVNARWTVSFPPNKGAPESISFNTLASWTEYPVEGVRHFSGTATYRTVFTALQNDLTSSYWLDLGKVKNFAEVRLNCHAFPTLWKAPFRLEVSNWLKDGKNSLEVKVTNLWPNRLIGDEQYPPEATYKGPIQAWPDWIKNGTQRPPTKRVTFTTWQFFTKDSPLLESGLIGPVRILRIPAHVIGG